MHEHAELIVQLTQHALAAPDVPSAVNPILEALVSRTAASGAAYFQADGHFYFARAASGVMPAGPAMDEIAVHGLPDHTPIFTAMARAGSPLFIGDTSEAEASAGFPDLGVTSLAAAPIRDSEGRVLGAFLMHTFEHHEWTTGEAALFAAVASTLAALTARLVAQEMLLLGREGALRAVGLALEYRDDETKGHTDRVTEASLALAVNMGEGSEDSLRALRWGAYLHDVGKIAVPDGILRKPGKLDDAEREQMRGHPAIGLEFGERIGFLPQGALDVILHHHERWDGAGYPSGLAGEAIPLAARIFAVCDVFDALVSERPYKRAWSTEEALAEIHAQAGTQFDPRVVEAFMRMHTRSNVVTPQRG